MPVHFKVELTDAYGKTIEAIEGAAQRLEDMNPVFGERGGPLCQAWAKSRLEMYQTKGASTGDPWPDHTRDERKYYLPTKRAALGRYRLPSNNLLRFSPNQSWAPARGERLFPGLTQPTHREFIYRRPDAVTVQMGTSVPWARTIDAGTGHWVGGRYRGKTRDGKSKRSTQRHVVRAPARKLIRFGEPFVEAFRLIFRKEVVKVGGKIGLSTQEVFDRINARGRRG